MPIETPFSSKALHFSMILAGVYVIRHRASRREYVGSSVNLYKRLSKHKSDLRAGIHHSPMLQAAWNKHGEEAFDIEVVELVEGGDLLAREQYWLDAVQPFYNTCKTAGNRLGFKASEETRAKQSAALKGRPKSKEHRQKLAEIRTGMTVKMSDEARARCGKKGQPKPEGFGDKIRALRLGTTMPDEAVEKMAAAKRKTYIFTAPDGAEYVATGLRKFCKEHGLNPSSMSAIACGKEHYLQHRGWTCRFAEKAGVVTQVTA